MVLSKNVLYNFNYVNITSAKFIAKLFLVLLIVITWKFIHVFHLFSMPGQTLDWNLH